MKEDQMNLYKIFPGIFSVVIFSILLLSGFSIRAYAGNTAKEYYDTGVIDEVSENYDDAIIDFTKAIDLDTNYAEAYYERGYCYNECKNRDYSQAIADETRAIELNPDYGRAYAERGYAYVMLGSDNASLTITDCNKAVELDPGSAMAYQYRGYAYGQLGNYSQEVTDETTAIGFNESSGWAYVARAQAYNRLAQYDKDRDDVRKAQDMGYPVDQELIDSLNANSGTDNGSSSPP